MPSSAKCALRPRPETAWTFLEAKMLACDLCCVGCSCVLRSALQDSRVEPLSSDPTRPRCEFPKIRGPDPDPKVVGLFMRNPNLPPKVAASAVSGVSRGRG